MPVVPEPKKLSAISRIASALTGYLVGNTLVDGLPKTAKFPFTLFEAVFSAIGHTHTKADIGLSLVPNVDATARASHTGTQAISTITNLEASLAAKADLVGGVVPTNQIPAIAIVTYLGSVASQAAMLALSGQAGDWCIRTDLSSTFVITGATPSLLASWTQLPGATGGVSSVNGQSGVVVLNAANVGAPATTLNIATAASLSGGGNLSASRTLQLVNDQTTPGHGKVYGTGISGTKGWVEGGAFLSGVVYGHTTPGSSSTSPPPADLYFDGSTTVVSVATESGSVTVSMTSSDPYDGSIWVDTSSLYSSGDYAGAFCSAISSSGIGVSAYDLGSGNVQLTNGSNGSTAYLTVTNVSGTTSVSGGGTGSDGSAPTGGTLDVGIMTVAKRLATGYWLCSEGFEAGSYIRLYDPINDETLWSVYTPSTGGGGAIQPVNSVTAGAFLSANNLRLQVVDGSGTPFDSYGGILGVYLFFF